VPDDYPDWREESARKLVDSKLSAAEREEVSRELAGYLEDLCSDGPARGLDEDAATQNAAALLADCLRRGGACPARATQGSPLRMALVSSHH